MFLCQGFRQLRARDLSTFVSGIQAAVCQGFGCFCVRDPGSCVPVFPLFLCHGSRQLCARESSIFVSWIQAAVCQGFE